MKTLILTTLILGIISCNSSKDANNSGTIQELSNNYNVVSIQGVESLTATPTIKFDLSSNNVSGNAGCNDYGGTMSIEGNKISFSDFMATEMYCDNMSTEQKFFSKLTKVDYFKVEKLQLKMFSKSDELLLVFEEGK